MKEGWGEGGGLEETKMGPLQSKGSRSHKVCVGAQSSLPMVLSLEAHYNSRGRVQPMP